MHSSPLKQPTHPPSIHTPYQQNKEKKEHFSHRPDDGTPDVGTPPGKLENLIKSIDRKSDKSLKANFIETSKYLWDVKKAFNGEGVDDTLRGLVLKSLRPIVNRLDGVGDAEDKNGLLRKILDLPSQEDIQRTLLVPTVPAPKKYKATPNEKLYLDGSGWIGEFCLWSRNNQINLAHLFWAGIFCVAAAARRNFYLERDMVRFWPNIVLILGG